MTNHPNRNRSKHQRGAQCIYRDMTARELDRAIDTQTELLAALKETLETLGDIADKLAHGSPMRNDLEAQCAAIRAVITKATGNA